MYVTDSYTDVLIDDLQSVYLHNFTFVQYWL